MLEVQWRILTLLFSRQLTAAAEEPVRHKMQMFTTYILSTLSIIMIVSCPFLLLIDVYLLLGIISPELNIKIDQKIRKAFNKPPVIILDPWDIRRRNIKWFIWIFVLSNLLVFAIIYLSY